MLMTLMVIVMIMKLMWRMGMLMKLMWRMGMRLLLIMSLRGW